jgi:methyl-accepting chemotaxis protein
MTIGKRIAYGFATIMLIQIAIGAVCYYSIVQFREANRLLNHTLEVLEQFKSLYSHLKSAESSMRGYVVAGDEAFLLPYKTEIDGTNDIRKQLKSSLISQSQKERFDKLETPLAGELAHFEDIIKIRKDPVNGAADAMAKIKLRRGLTFMAEIQEGLAKMEEFEKALLEKRSAAAEANGNYAILAIVLGTLLALVVASVGGFVVIQSITGPVRKLLEGTEKIAAGMLSHRINLTSHDEIGDLAKAFDHMAGKREQAHEAMREAANQISSASAEILASTTQQASGAQEQAAAVTQTMTTVDEVTQTSDQAAQRAKTVGETVQRTLEIGKAGRKVVEESLGAMEMVKEKVENTAENILTLAEQAQAIGDIIATVNDIAEQTNLLALNAAIEASRAGEHGRGFTVVAGEVKILADQSKKATGQVRQILGEIQKATNTAVLSTEQVTKGVAAAIAVGGQAGETIKTLGDTLSETSRVVTQIAASVGQQAMGMTQINQAMKNIDMVAKQNTAATRQAAEAAENLNTLGTRLAGLTAE